MCVPRQNGAGVEVMCNPIRCPSTFGLDVINPICIEWDMHEDFAPKPPMCCPPPPMCLSDGSCEYQGHKFNNLDDIPANLTGCEKRCYCDGGQVSCREACYEVSPEPPRYLRCSKEVAIKIPKEDRPCCLHWGCPDLDLLPDRVKQTRVEPVNDTTLRISLGVPRAVDGRAGFVKIYYTEGIESHPDYTKWPNKEITPDGGLLSLDEYGNINVLLSQLLPNKQYFLRSIVNVRDHDHVSGFRIMSGEIASIRTPATDQALAEGLPKIKKIDIQLGVSEVKAVSARISWRFFSTEEKQYIDGVQIRFHEIINGGPASGVPGTTPFIHRDTNFFLLEDLKPDVEYEADVYLIPVPNAKTELISKSAINFRTVKPDADPYMFDINLHLDEVGHEFVQLSWSGVPNPHQQFVNIYRILYIEDELSSVEPPRSVFKVAKINSFKATRIGYMSSGTK